MSKYRNALPQLSGTKFLTDSGLETTLVFHDGRELPHFASFDLLRTQEGKARILDYYRQHAGIARRHKTGFLLETVTWRANPDWGRKLGYSLRALEAANEEAVEMFVPLRDELEAAGTPAVISGNIGPRGDGYNPQAFMSVEEARDYHGWQVGVLARQPVDMLAAFTMTYANEATGIVLAARDHDVPVGISFTLETDGRLPSGQALGDAIDEVDRKTGRHAAYFMISCAHPEHFDAVLDPRADWASRIRAVRANASRRSHAELDEATELDDGNPGELGRQYRDLVRLLPNLSVLGGCCGTDHRHVAAIAMQCMAVEDAA
jgi:S-methylmethionine-dependent homocysteine/selenocysteine methylase